MPYLYPEEVSASNSGRKFFWGSLYGSADALALIEYIQQDPQVILLIADNIAHLDSLHKSLNFYNNNLEILTFDNWEVLPYDQFSPHPDITSNRLTTLSKLKNLKNGIVITTLETLFSHLCPIEFSEKYSLPYPILADVTKECAEEYGVMGTFMMMTIAKRESFIIDPEGTVVKHYKKVNPDSHTQEVIDELKSLQS